MPIIPWLAISAVFYGVSMYQKTKAANSRIKEIELQSKQSTIQRMEESISNIDLLNRTLKSQVAESTIRGVGLDSLSFEAIQRDAINQISREESSRDLEESLFQRGLKIEKSNVKKTLFASLFGDVAQIGFSTANYRSSSPSVGR